MRCSVAVGYHGVGEVGGYLLGVLWRLVTMASVKSAVIVTCLSSGGGVTAEASLRRL